MPPSSLSKPLPEWFSNSKNDRIKHQIYGTKLKLPLTNYLGAHESPKFAPFHEQVLNGKKLENDYLSDFFQKANQKPKIYKRWVPIQKDFSSKKELPLEDSLNLFKTFISNRNQKSVLNSLAIIQSEKDLKIETLEIQAEELTAPIDKVKTKNPKKRLKSAKKICWILNSLIWTA